MDLNRLPCPLCGYEAPGTDCPHCRLERNDPLLADGSGGGPWADVLDGLRAVPMGFRLLATTPGTKRFLVPPVLLTMAAFVLAFLGIWDWLSGMIEGGLGPGTVEPAADAGWFTRALQWLIAKGVLLWAAKLGGLLVYLLAASVLTLWIFSIVYEAIAGPFLDEVHGRIEKRWFGKNPRDEIERPTKLPATICAWISAAAAVPAVLCGFLWWTTSGVPAWWALACAPLSFVLAGAVHREYGKWLAWVVRVEGRTLLVSVKASLLAAALLLPALVLKLIPVVGIVLFALVAGFATALTLLDIPFSRRQWPLEKRVQFLLRNFAAMAAFGAVASLLFVIPLIGPVVMVPAASVGGLWLVCRLDKNPLRPLDRRLRPVPGSALGGAPPRDPASSR